MRLRRLFILAATLCFCSLNLSAQKKNSNDPSLEFQKAYEVPVLEESDKVNFKETWAWVLKDRESSFNPEIMNITDLCYFSADVNSYGEITDFPKADYFKNFSGRKHLVITCSSYSLTHMILVPQFKIRDRLIDSIVENSTGYDGVQIDFETILSKDDEYFYSFLKHLRKRLPKEMMFTICVPARTKVVNGDVFKYPKIEPLVDKVIIMAYDQHWSTSKPGPVAGMDWCEKICNYAVTVIPKEKLVMGLPFYARSWQDENYGKAWYNTGANRIMRENGVTEIKRENDVPHVEFKATVNVNLWFDDAYSLVRRCQMYIKKDVDSVAFWRIGQEDLDFWKWINQKETVEEQSEETEEI